MEARCTTTVLVVVALLSISDGSEEALQSLEPGVEKSFPGNKTPLREFHDHAEYKSQSSGEDVVEHDTTGEIPELLPTPVAIKLEESDAEFIASEKKPSVPKKGVVFKKPSVVPKKGVHFGPSVVGKKGADPESSTPSVSPRKGVELTQGNPIPPSSGSQGYDLLSISSEGMDNTNVSMSSGNTKPINVQTKLNGSEKEVSTDKEISSNIPTPEIVQKKENSDDTHLSQDWKLPQSIPKMTLVTVNPTEFVKISNTSHFKPTTADDSSASSNHFSYVPIFMIAIMVVLVTIIVAVGYRRLKDIWERRHYKYVDFLIDGMYE